MEIHINKSGKHPIFDRQYPVFNIFYPLQVDAQEGDVLINGFTEFEQTSFAETKSVALYFHFPFCETICNFCPFTRGKYHDHEIITRYLSALIREIEIKATLVDLKRIPVRAIFVGGGTPSLLTADEIRLFGHAIHKHFDLSDLCEFSFECEVKSVTEDKVIALRDIGVTNARFGLQTFDRYWRDMFDLTASIDQLYAAMALFKKYLPYTSFDILYAMNGQTVSQFESDLKLATEMGNDLIDVYPIDNVVTQIKLHNKTKKLGLAPLSADTRYEMNLHLRNFMRERGFIPHNGHGYVRTTAEDIALNEVVSRKYTFEYHNHVYGYDRYEVVGFGVNAISVLHGKVLTNPNNRNQYIRQMIEGRELDVLVSRHGPEIDASRGVVTRLPYHGHIRKDAIEWDLLPPETLNALEAFQTAGLVIEKEDELVTTEAGWRWYVNMMYCSMPKGQKKVLNASVVHSLRQEGRELTTEQVVFNTAPFEPVA